MVKLIFIPIVLFIIGSFLIMSVAFIKELFGFNTITAPLVLVVVSFMIIAAIASIMFKLFLIAGMVVFIGWYFKREIKR